MSWTKRGYGSRTRDVMEQRVQITTPPVRKGRDLCPGCGTLVRQEFPSMAVSERYMGIDDNDNPWAVNHWHIDCARSAGYEAKETR